MNKNLICIIFLAAICNILLISTLVVKTVYAVPALGNDEVVVAKVLSVKKNNNVSKLNLQIIDHNDPGLSKKIEVISKYALSQIQKGDEVEAIIFQSGDEHGSQLNLREIKVVKKGETPELEETEEKGSDEKTLVSLIFLKFLPFWLYFFLIIFAIVLLFYFFGARKINIQDDQLISKSNKRWRIWRVYLITAIIVSISILVFIGYFKFFGIKNSEEINEDYFTNETDNPSIKPNVFSETNPKDFGDTGIIVISPEHNQTIFSPLKITGYIDDFGDGWEADFGSVELVDGNGEKIASAQLGVDATDDQGNYKSRPYYFESTLIFRLPQTEIGTLIFYEHTARGDMTEKFRLSVKFDKIEDKKSEINPKDYSLENYPLKESPIYNQLSDYCYKPENEEEIIQKDTRLVKNNGEIVIPSIRQLIFASENKEPNCVTEIGVFSTPTDGKYLYLKVSELSFKEHMSWPVYRLDISNLSVKRVLHVDWGGSTDTEEGFISNDNELLSDGKRVIRWNEKDVFLVNLETDSSSIIYTAPNNQWLVSNVNPIDVIGKFLDTDVKVNENKVTIGVYDQNQTFTKNPPGYQDYDINYVLVNRITITIPDNQ